MSILQIDSVSKRFPRGNYGVRNLTLHLKPGVLGLLGPNGAGKTTLMQMIATISRPTTGSIRFQDQDIVKNPDFLRRQLGYLPQDFGVYDNLTPIEYLSYFAELKGVKDRNKVMAMLRRSICIRC